MQKILVPTELTYLSKCALNLGIEIAKLANAKMEVLSVVESRSNQFMSENEKFSHDPTSSIRNIQDTEASRERMQERAAEISNMLPGQEILPKIVFGEKVSTLIDQIKQDHADLVIMGGDLYDPSDNMSHRFITASPSPIVILKCMINGLDNFSDIIFLSDTSHDSPALIEKLKEFQKILQAKLHVVRVNTPSNFLSAKQCNQTLEDFAGQHALENFKLISLDARTEFDGLSSYCETIKNAFVGMGLHKRNFMQSLITNRNKASEMIANSVHPVWTFKG